jgi:hypothetical protein
VGKIVDAELEAQKCPRLQVLQAVALVGGAMVGS